MKRCKTKGICSYCRTAIPKNIRSIMKHISDCKAIVNSKRPVSPHMILMIEAKYIQFYWMVIKAKPDTRMETVDQFLKDIWVECCWHLSEFSESGHNISMDKKISDVFLYGNKIDYIYDFGSPTEITLSLIQSVDMINDKAIQVILQNEEIEFKCSYCGKKASDLCQYCSETEDIALCEACRENHECFIEEEEDCLVPIHNSPRLGVCGYTGYDTDATKYFPVLF